MTDANHPGDERKLRELLTSGSPEAVVLALQILESSDSGPEVWRTVFDRNTTHSVCLLAAKVDPRKHSEQPPFTDLLVAAFEDGFSRESTEGLSDAAERWLKAVGASDDVDHYTKLHLCMQFSPVGLESLVPDVAMMPAVPPEDATFVAAAIGGTLGQILWRDLALAGVLELSYLADSYTGDRLMPDARWRLVDEEINAASSVGSEFICGHGASYSLPWIEKQKHIDPVAIRTELLGRTSAESFGMDRVYSEPWFRLYYGSEYQEVLEPLFTEDGLVHSALEGLCDGHLLLLDEPAFDRRIKEVFESDEELCYVSVRALQRPVRDELPQACFRNLSDERKDWIADVLIAAAGSDSCPQSAALSKHVLGWMTIHPATPPALRERLTARGFGVTHPDVTDGILPERREVPSSPPATNTPVSELDRGERPDRQRTARLEKIVTAWEKICDAEGVADLGCEAFIAAHYAKLVLTEQVILTKAGWTFVDAAEGSIIEGVNEDDENDVEEDDE